MNYQQHTNVIIRHHVWTLNDTFIKEKIYT